MRVRTLALILVACLAVAACGDDAPAASASGSRPPAPAATTSAPTAAGPEDAGVDTSRIIPLDGDVAEVVFALGFGDRVVATDLSATYPPEAGALPQIGYQRALAAEPILAFEPTLLIGTESAGPPDVIDELRRAVDVVIVPTFTGREAPAAKIRAIAEVLGVPTDGERLADEVDAAIAAAAPADPATEPAAALRVGMLYVRGDQTQLLFGEGSGIDWLIDATGATDIADELGIADHAQLSAEALVAAAPDVLLVTEDGLASVGGLDALVALPALAGTPAAQRRAILAYDAQFMLGNGPRTGEFLARLRADLNELARDLSEQP